MRDADCIPGREPRSVAASDYVFFFLFIWSKLINLTMIMMHCLSYCRTRLAAVAQVGHYVAGTAAD